ncbi:hypothetical protein FLA105534_03683 [Flavobacterium bizetiae]|uniref:Uncharacterized protein n=1 Tax=Flavobacterium bizetiae TaxID=2704140 RepID=A0A6J4GQS2_9FLAO|nr:DUF4173 domain-containing protein [Flavobacterium bizetiae]CAA9201600.1 hypothetical protein FLA105534_03683 [Flavobacterium bizetiae]CAD5344588.1 hypothetical protein FLA105535_04595 [Flavobacterium bizetiae]CAD5350657.1 hypothetical protein FLA105534_04650 [Flavobacterium bizetiae]
MKKHQIILASSLIFALLFYNESVGVNLAIFGLVLTGFICYFFQDRFTDRSHLILVVTSVLSCLAFAWYGDFASFLALAMSILFLQFKTQESKLKIIQIFPLVFLNAFASVGRIFMFNQWLPEKKIHNDFAKKLVAFFVIPAIFIGLFFIVYSFGSNHFSSLFTDYTLDIDIVQLLLISILGFYISFSFWNYWVPDLSYEKNAMLDNDFDNIAEIKNQSTFSFLDIDFERKSGEITLVLLNIMLLVFIATYNYEQFFEVVKNPNLSADTHERVNSVIFSIIMAVGLILFYFKGGFNFDKKAANLKKLAKIWIVLNGLLIASTFIKNSEYIAVQGLTYKRLGVYAFLILAIIGLVFVFLKITKQKTNAYLANQMVWYFYGTVLLCSFVNWGNLITNYNISVNKCAEPIFLTSLNFNDEARREYFSKNNLDGGNAEIVREEMIQNYQSAGFLSKALYYEFLKK